MFMFFVVKFFIGEGGVVNNGFFLLYINVRVFGDVGFCGLLVFLLLGFVVGVVWLLDNFLVLCLWFFLLIFVVVGEGFNEV